MCCDHCFLIRFLILNLLFGQSRIPLLCFWIHPIVGVYVDLESLIDSCLLCCLVEIWDHSYFDSAPIVCSFIFWAFVLALCAITFTFLFKLVVSAHPCNFEPFVYRPGQGVLIAPWDKVFFGMFFGGRRCLYWKFEHPIPRGCLSFTFVLMHLLFGLSYLWCMCCMLWCRFPHYWSCLLYGANSIFGVEPSWCKVQVLIFYLISCLSVFLWSLSMVNGHKAKASWPRASPLTLSSDICFHLFWCFLLWNYRWPIQIVLYHCKLWFCSSLEHMGWYDGSCSHFV